jgi:DNA-binding MarR family transcriptional regulator
MLGRPHVVLDPPQEVPASDAGTAAALDPLTRVKLGEDPCWFSFRINYLANHFNVPVYDWITQRFALSRPEFVVLYSLSLREGVAAKNIVLSTGFPKNTISRAIQRLLRRKLVARTTDAVDRRSFSLWLTAAGRHMVEAAMPLMLARQNRMLASLSPAERVTLSELLGRLVFDSPGWPGGLDPSSFTPEGKPS